MPIEQLATHEDRRSGMGWIVAFSWLAASIGAVLWVWQQGGLPWVEEVLLGRTQTAADLVLDRAAPGHVTSTTPNAAEGPRALTEAEAMRQVELAAERSTQVMLQEQRERDAKLAAARERTQAAEAARDAERKAEIAADMENQSKLAAQRGVEIVMYTTSWCGACKHARRYLKEHGFLYEERDIEHSPEWRRECQALNPRLSVPTIRIDNRMMVGFSSNTFENHYAKAVADRRARH